ncbi:MAG: protein-glutamate O-methyltransferase CheR [Acidobacteriota bacterium]|nr:protein-glutamate O-methyltransferase CheR [Acidobacteriota bacterium]
MTDHPEFAARVSGDSTYGPLKDYLIAATGLAYYEGRDQLLAGLIGRRLFELGLPNCAAYFRLLTEGDKGGAEREAITAQLTIGETYFFRDQTQFDAIREVILPDIIERKRAARQVRIWSAGCATGAEPYSLAILLRREFQHRIEGWQVSILATDINPRFLEAAAAGRFRDWAFRATPEALKQECFSREGPVWSIRPEYKRSISFRLMNLAEGEFPADINESAGFDLILCRNVMIYFTPEASRRLVQRFRAALSESGWFLVGAVEHNLETYNAFQMVSASGATLYRKPKSVTREPLAPALRGGFFGEEKVPARVCAPPEPEPPSLEGLRRLADSGDWTRAVPYCDCLLARDGLNPAVYFYRALVLEQVGVPDEAARSLRQAIYLDPNFLLAHYYLGLALAGKKPRAAQRSFENVLKLLSGLSDDQPVLDGDGLTVASLRGLASLQLAASGAA